MALTKRQLNIELLRIIAMLMVMGLHANFTSLKSPSTDIIFTAGGLTRVFLEFMCLVAVNVFVMISGWFKIRPSLRGFCNFMWQVIYIVGILWIIGVSFFNLPANHKTILAIVGLYGGGGWFVASYIGLYILAPVLNAFVEHYSLKYITYTVIAFFTFEFLWGNTLSVDFIIAGYSTFSFIGIYLFSGLLKKIDLKYAYRYYLYIFLLSVFLNVCIYVMASKAGLISIRDMTLNYINPLIIIGAASLLLYFSKIDIPNRNRLLNRIIIWISSSCFAAYLLHVGMGYALNLFCKGVRLLLWNCSFGRHYNLYIIRFFRCGGY